MKKEIVQIIVQSCTLGILCFVFLTLFICIDKTFKPNVLRKFFIAIFVAMLLLGADVTDYFFQSVPYYQKYCPLLAAFGFTFRITCIGFLASIANRKYTRFHKTIYILMGINLILSFLSMKFGFYFTFDSDYNWYMGKLIFIPYFIVAFYEGLIIYSVILNFKVNVVEAIMITACTLCCIAANLIELFNIQRLILSQTLLVSIVFYYLCLNVQLYRLDPLTGLMNRRCFFNDIKHFSKNKLIIISMNINNLGKINQEKGLLEGDNTVTTCAAMMSDAFRLYASVYRTNGDEFIVMFKNKTLDQATNCISRLQKRMMKTKYRIAVGFTEYFPGNDVEEILAIARDKMLENKAVLKNKENK